MSNARVPVYSLDESLVGHYSPAQVERLLSTRRVKVIRSRKGEIRRIYLLENARISSISDYQGQRYSHNHASDHPNPLYQNPENVWAFRYLSRKDRPVFKAVLDSVVTEAADA
jgi:hypothetical protein